jgi:SRSO17 transposase
MSGMVVEDLLELWSAELRGTKDRLRSLFTHPSVAASAAAFLDTLLGPERRKTGWMRAEAVGDRGPWRQQAVLGRSHWEADTLRDVVRDYALETLAEADAVLVFDETGFLKQGKASCGVGRQYTGSAGKITNCQIGVFAAYVSSKGHAFIDRQLYLPKDWTSNPARLAAAHVPETVKFATKPRLAVAMIERAIQAGVPFAWVAADTVYGGDEVQTAARRAGKGYVLGIPSSQLFWLGSPEGPVSNTAQQLAEALPASQFVRLSAGDGAKGPRLYEWAYLELAEAAADVAATPASAAVWTAGLLVRRRLGDGEQAYFLTRCPQGTPLAVLVAVEGRRWAIEDAFETAKTELGLAHNETRSWQGWHRHVSLVMLAFAMLMVIRHKAEACAPPQKSPNSQHRRWCAGPLRKSVVLLGV